MNTKKIIIAVIVVVVAVASYMYVNKNARQQAIDDAAVIGRVIINMDETSFSPDTITIKKNTEVIFKNAGTEAHWPASNIHPTHGIYPEFDPQRPIPPGGSWSFIFTRVGTWRMHDHLMPRILGTITVTE